MSWNKLRILTQNTSSLYQNAPKIKATRVAVQRVGRMSDTLQLVVSLHTLNVELNERHDKLKRIGHEKAAGDL
jgi:hypothetical protein